jgi:hypothetical protein
MILAAFCPELICSAAYFAVLVLLYEMLLIKTIIEKLDREELYRNQPDCLSLTDSVSYLKKSRNQKSSG